MKSVCHHKGDGNTVRPKYTYICKNIYYLRCSAGREKGRRRKNLSQVNFSPTAHFTGWPTFGIELGVASPVRSGRPSHRLLKIPRRPDRAKSNQCYQSLTTLFQVPPPPLSKKHSEVASRPIEPKRTLYFMAPYYATAGYSCCCCCYTSCARPVASHVCTVQPDGYS